MYTATYYHGVRVTMRCGYESTGPSKLPRVLRLRSSRKNGWNLPLRTIKEDGRSVAISDFHLDLSEARDSSSTSRASSEDNKPVEDKCSPHDDTCPPQGDMCPPQGLTAATPLAPN